MPPVLAPVAEPSEDKVLGQSTSDLSEVSLDVIPIRELTGLAQLMGIKQDDCFEAGELRKKIEEKRNLLR